MKTLLWGIVFAATILGTSYFFDKSAKPSVSVSVSRFPEIFPDLTSTTVDEPTSTPVVSINNPVQKSSQVSTTTPPAVSSIKSTVSFDTINTSTRAALVNIICTTPSNYQFSAISGSGVFISSDGIILTNAHVAEYFLLKDFNGHKDFVTCVIRTGSPASSAYKAVLVYISPLWIKNNASALVTSDPMGTGEYDYAFLKVISTEDNQPLPSPFSVPSVSVDTHDDIQKGDSVLLASYPAEFLGGLDIIKDLYQTSAIGYVSNVFTFDKSTIDVISTPGTVVSQKGSSGGAAVNANGKLVGIISTSSIGDTTGSRDLRAITLSYINRDLQIENNTDILGLLAQPDIFSTQFNTNSAPELTDILTKAILKK